MSKFIGALQDIIHFVMGNPDDHVKMIVCAVATVFVTHIALTKSTRAFGAGEVTGARVALTLFALFASAIAVPALLQAYTVPLLAKADWVKFVPVFGGVAATLLIAAPIHWVTCHASYGKSIFAIMFAVIAFAVMVFATSNLYDGVTGMAGGMRSNQRTRDARNAQTF